VLIAVKPLRCLIFALALTALGCHAQMPVSSGKLSPDMARRVEVLIRAKSKVPPNYDVAISPRMKSDVPGFDAISVTFSSDGKSSKPIDFLLSTDGKTLAQFNKFDISQDPKDLVPAGSRPPRGGPANAPVLIVGFDDLECPYCAKMHQQLFPAILERYKNQVHIVYRDFPLSEIHPWAMHAAIDVNCVGAHSQTGYWNLVDYIHAHAADIGGTEKSVAKANEMLDGLATDEGKRQKLNAEELKACIVKQDDTAMKASVKDGEALGVSATPTLFINGEELDGAEPIEDIYRMIDGALVAAGQTPPPPLAPTVGPAPAAKTGN
jgi:protein-disulfide isomerase